MGIRPGLRRFGTNLRELRERHFISQEELGALAGLHRTYIGGIERGERNVSLVNILKIARALRIPASKLLLDL
ncbi:MAG TPA: helix-turn-helix transcriptional regulator [Elusimicrobiota bacterium]|nr:helix-turn-helix transcriptional regulator [Elusimicrobiota bacterium]